MTDSPIQVIDNFLDDQDFKDLADACMRSHIYMCLPATAYLNENDGSIDACGMDDELAKGKKPHEAMMQAVLVSKFSTFQNVNDLYLMLYDIFKKVQLKLDVKTLWMARVNVTTAAAENYVGSLHEDNHQHPRKEYMHVAILYLNSNNGGTKFEDGTFVESKFNRCVIFPRHIKHAGVWCTNRKLRYVMNLNYEKNDE